MVFMMTKSTFWQSLSNTLRRFPWVISGLYIVWRLFQSKYSLGVVGVLFNAEGDVLLVEHVFHPKKPWGLPGGWVNHKEDPADAIRREMHEELSLDITVGPLLLAEFHKGNHLDLAYLVDQTNEIGALSYELLGFRWYSIESLPRLYTFQQRAIQAAIIFRETYGSHTTEIRP